LNSIYEDKTENYSKRLISYLHEETCGINVRVINIYIDKNNNENDNMLPYQPKYFGM